MPQKQAAVLLINGLFDETQMYGTNNVHLIWVNTRKCADWTSKHLPALFQVSHQTNQLFNLIKGSINAISKLGTVDVSKQITENASEKSSSAVQFASFNVFFWPVFEFTSNLLHQNSSNYRTDLKILVLKSDLGNEN